MKCHDLGGQAELTEMLLQSRRVHNVIMLEASIENTSRSPLVLDHLRFDPEPYMSAEEVKTPLQEALANIQHRHLQEYLRDLKVCNCVTWQCGALELVTFLI